MRINGQPKIVVLGGGFGGLEAAFYLRMRLQDRAHITLVSAEDHFLFKPNTIYIPFGLDPQRLKISLSPPTRRKHIEFINGVARDVDPARKMVAVNGQTLSYDYLVVATGAGMRPEEVPGLREHALTIWTPEEMQQLGRTYQSLVNDVQSGAHRRVLFLVPPNNKCSGPLYEMVFMLDTWLRRRHVRDRVELIWSTYEGGYIQAFGPRLHEVVTAEFARRNIAGFPNFAVDNVQDGLVAYRGGERLAYDLLISFPPYVAATPFVSLPSDGRGFIATDLATRRVQGHQDIFAVGDAGDFPVKQAFLAFLQADAAAEHLAAEILGTAPECSFEPNSMCVMEQFDKATFAQVPLRVTGVAEKPVEVRPDLPGLYRVGSSTTWRLGKKLLGVYLPWRFGAGEPFHAGLPWKGMEAGLRVMSRLLAA